MDMDDNLSPMLIPIIMFLIPMVAIVGGFAYAIVKATLRSRVRELEIRERIALIERGLVPAPEVDPGGFDRAMAQHARMVVRRKPTGRHRRAGVILLGVGFGLMLLLATTADVMTGIGVGGFIVMIGLAFLLNGLVDGHPDDSTVRTFDPLPPAITAPAPPPPVTPAEPRRD